MRKGEKIKMFFSCAGVVSEEERIVKKFDDKTITTDETIHPDNSKKEEYEKFDRKTGRCLNDNTMFGGRRFIDPQ